MNFYRKNPLFAIGLTICALLLIGELALIYERFATSRAAAKRLEQRKADLEAMAQLTPPPTREIAAAIEADLAKAQASLASMQNELKGRGLNSSSRTFPRASRCVSPSRPPRCLPTWLSPVSPSLGRSVVLRIR